MRRPWPWLLVAAIGFVVILVVAPEAAATGWRLAFVTAAAPFAGAVVMLMIARLTGSDWSPLEPFALAAPVLALAAIGIGLIQLAAQPPAHLGLWQQPIVVGLRAVIAAGALAWVGTRVVRGVSVTFAAIALALYAIVSTVIGTDWLLGGSPGHAVSSVGMILFTQEMGAACAVMLLVGWGAPRFRSDMGKLLVAAGVGLSYLVFMDFLILWYGDLPSKIGWYVDRASVIYDIVVALALLFGMFGPIAAQALIGGRRGQRLAGASALVGLVLIDLWWVKAGIVALIAAVLAGAIMLAAGMMLTEWRRARG
ncbi:MAG: hypothetical protein ACTHMG_06650 [Sphingomonas sp.]